MNFFCAYANEFLFCISYSIYHTVTQSNISINLHSTWWFPHIHLFNLQHSEAIANWVINQSASIINQSASIINQSSSITALPSSIKLKYHLIYFHFFQSFNSIFSIIFTTRCISSTPCCHSQIITSCLPVINLDIKTDMPISLQIQSPSNALLH